MRLIKNRSKLILWSIILLFTCPAFAQTSVKVGAAKVDMTPSVDALPTGYSKINDNLYCRAIVIDNGTTSAALVAIDQGMISNDDYDKWTKEIEGATGIPALNIFISASHTHGVPFGGNDKAGLAVIESVKQAHSKLQPAQMSYNTGQCYLNVNRDVIDPETRLWSQGPNYDGPSDKTVAVVTFKDMKGEPIAVYYNYAMHANTMFLSGSVSADFPGETSKYVEEYYDNKLIALFSSGAAGDQNPISTKPMTNVGEKKSEALLASGKAKNLPEAIMMAGSVNNSEVNMDPAALARQAQMIVSMGQILGEEILRTMSLPQRPETSVAISASQNTIICPGRNRIDVGNREGKPGVYEDGDPVNIKLSLLQLGDVAICGVNAEVYNIIAQKLKEESPYTKTIFASITNGAANSGYVPNDDAFQRYTFQVLSSRLQPNHAEKEIINGLVDMMEK